MFVANISDGICLYVSLEVLISLPLFIVVLVLIRRLFPRVGEEEESLLFIISDLCSFVYNRHVSLYNLLLYTLYRRQKYEQYFPRWLIHSVYVSVGWLFPSYPV